MGIAKITELDLVGLYHEPRIGRNPKTGELVDIPGRYVPYFRPGKELRQRVDETGRRD
uniref:DNA-binding protein n=1 Tax=Candidatus Kentrum eta TaxID=2126337 RepID=A0A450V0K0_9GAMM|nr:MAG: DNA-binding protein [Candidatus Kentron sp. H]VFJ91684.1 MAG: DNA-binding protein [Candidatus Kentron sp. H]VFJ98313.1 MAG: DNA-binding protein [Candidatus Kentron sp. H]